jgi:hypothetical protein
VSVVVRRSGPIARFWEKLNAGAPGESRAIWTKPYSVSRGVGGHGHEGKVPSKSKAY